MKIFGTLDFTRDPFKVTNSPIMHQESNRQTVLLNLVNKSEITNSEIPIFDRFVGKISDNVTKILQQKLQLTNDKIDIESTKNSYGFVGKGKGALNIILDLCRRSVPVKGDAGYFFYQTKSGYKFRSIESLLSEKQKFTFNYFGGFKKDNTKNDNDNKLVREPLFLKDQNVGQVLKGGVYRSRNIFFDPRTFCYEEVNYDLSKDGVKKTLGGAPPFADDVKSFTKTFHHILDVGTLDVEPSTEVNNDPREWLATSRTRYNLLHTQMMFIQVPCNPELKAGEVIRCEIEFPGEKKEEGAVSQQQSGNYIILHLCHSFNSQRSFTSMTVVRDTYGLHTNKG